MVYGGLTFFLKAFLKASLIDISFRNIVLDKNKKFRIYIYSSISQLRDIKIFSESEEDTEAEEESEPGAPRHLGQRGCEAVSEGGDNLKYCSARHALLSHITDTH